MEVNGKTYDINDLLDKTKCELHNDFGNGIFLSDYEIQVLNKYQFDIKKYNNLSSLIYDIEEYLNDVNGQMEVDDLELLSSNLAELFYYNNTNK